MAKWDSDFIPYTFQIPDFRSGGQGDRRLSPAGHRHARRTGVPPLAHRREVFRAVGIYRRPTLVSFNGRNFDIPLMELAAFRYGIAIPGRFGSGGRDVPRNWRDNVQAHLDLCELLTNFGCTRFHGGLNLAANLLGKPGKMDVHGDMVQDMYDAGRLCEINDYCRCDVLDTYFVFSARACSWASSNWKTSRP